ncbi:MAG: ESPR domain-containing protein, partial [Gammaproteobacteria bacterium]|nr:ESPR domain-containing protein [Gammaproteobacteria bacterium]
MNKHGSMNRFFRLIFNEALGAWIPVAESTRARGKRCRRGSVLLAPLLAVVSPSLAAVAAPAPTTLPTGGTVVAGAATLTSSTTTASAVLNVDQTSQRAVIDWNTFDLGSAAQVTFVQP